jgi:hypothetical protein
MIRDDPTGSLRASLQGHLDAADALRARAHGVFDHCGFLAWRAQVADWRAQCAGLLRGEFEQEAFEEFRRGMLMREVPQERWRDGLRVDMRGLGNMIELLASLRNTLPNPDGGVLARLTRFDASERR